MTATVWMLKIVLPYPEEMNILVRIGWMCLPIALGGFVYAVVTWKAGCGEWEWVREVFTRAGLREEGKGGEDD
jgi:hypothetical protein